MKCVHSMHMPIKKQHSDKWSAVIVRQHGGWHWAWVGLSSDSQPCGRALADLHHAGTAQAQSLQSAPARVSGYNIPSSVEERSSAMAPSCRGEGDLPPYDGRRGFPVSITQGGAVAHWQGFCSACRSPPVQSPAPPLVGTKRCCGRPPAETPESHCWSG